MLNDDALHDILEAGVWAPSAENRHAFRYSVHGATLRLYFDHELANATADQLYVALLSVGAVIENMRIAASVHALDCDVTYAEQDADALLTFAPGTALADELAPYIKQRHTNRRAVFQGPRLHATEQQALQVALAPLGSRWRVRWFDDSRSRNALSVLMRDAEALRFANAQLHQAMFGGIRFDVGWHGGASEGLPPAALHIEPGMRRAFAGLRHWSFMRVLARIGMHKGIALRAAYFPARFAPHLCVLGSDTPVESRDDMLEAGRAMERAWLAATQLDLAVQPFAASVALARSGRSALDETTRATLVHAWQRTLPDSYPIMVFRLGRAAPPVVRAGRPAPAAFAYR